MYLRIQINVYIREEKNETSLTNREEKKMEEEMMMRSRKAHFILVHGACHGAWSWYKVKPILESEGHKVTALDLAASGINMKKLHEVSTMSECAQPLIEIMESVPPEEKVILVGHSFGGMSLALAMDSFPEKISAAVFLTAFMPDISNPPSYVLDQFFKQTTISEFLDTEFSFDRGPEKPATSMLFRPKCLSSKLYQLSPMEDITLATTLMRPASLYQEDLLNTSKFTKEGYGSVNRVYIVCKADKIITPDFQRWMIENYPVKGVKEIEGADHMPMFSKPQELCHCLFDIANTYL